ncbi:MAG: hypothetical protein ACOCQR_01230 [bacterium]
MKKVTEEEVQKEINRKLREVTDNDFGAGQAVIDLVRAPFYKTVQPLLIEKRYIKQFKKELFVVAHKLPDSVEDIGSIQHGHPQRVTEDIVILGECFEELPFEVTGKQSLLDLGELLYIKRGDYTDTSTVLKNPKSTEKNGMFSLFAWTATFEKGEVIVNPTEELEYSVIHCTNKEYKEAVDLITKFVTVGRHNFYSSLSLDKFYPIYLIPENIRETAAKQRKERERKLADIKEKYKHDPEGLWKAKREMVMI